MAGGLGSIADLMIAVCCFDQGIGILFISETIWKRHGAVVSQNEGEQWNTVRIGNVFQESETIYIFFLRSYIYIYNIHVHIMIYACFLIVAKLCELIPTQHQEFKWFPSCQGYVAGWWYGKMFLEQFWWYFFSKNTILLRSPQRLWPICWLQSVISRKKSLAFNMGLSENSVHRNSLYYHPDENMFGHTLFSDNPKYYTTNQDNFLWDQKDYNTLGRKPMFVCLDMSLASFANLSEEHIHIEAHHSEGSQRYTQHQNYKPRYDFSYPFAVNH